MARRRNPVQALQETLRPTPIAAPVDGFADPGQIRTPLLDFSPISNTLQGYFQEEAKRDAERKIQAGEAWAIERPDLVRQLEEEAAAIKDADDRSKWLKEQFDFLQRNGSIPAAADPYWQIGRQRATARLLVTSYRDRVLQRMNETTTLRDANGQPVEPPSADQILAQEWEKISQSPALGGFYGQQEAIGVKAQVDEEFRTRAGMNLAKAQEETYRSDLARDIGSRFDRLVATNQVIDSETLAPLTQFLDQEVYGHNVQNPRELVLNALEVSFERLASVDADETLRAVHAAEDLVIGGVRLGDDRGEYGLRLQNMLDKYRENQRESRVREAQKTDAERKVAIQKGESRYVRLLLQAREEGHSVTQVADQLARQFLQEDDATGEFGGNGAFVVNELYEFARHVDANRQSDQQVINDFNVLLADGRLEDAQALAKGALASGSLNGSDYASALGDLEQRRSVSPFLENNGQYAALKSRYRSERPQGFAGEIQAKLDARALDLERKLETDAAAFVRSTVGQPDRERLVRTWLEDREAQDSQILRQLEDDIRSRRDQLEVDVRQRLSRFQDSREQIDAGLANGSLTLLEAQGLREENDKAIAARERFFQSDAYRDEERFLEQQWQAELGGVSPTPEQITALDVAKQSFRDAYSEKLDAFLGDPKASPSTFELRSRAALQATRKEVSDQLFPGGRSRIQAGIPKGESSAESAQAAADLKNDLALSQALGVRFSVPEFREHLGPADIAPNPSPDVPASFYKEAANWMSGRDPILSRPTTRADVEATAYRLLTSTPRPLRNQAGAAMLSVMGVDATAVLAGRVQILPPDSEAVLREIDVHKQLKAHGITIPAYEETMRALQDRLTPIVLDISDVNFPPYTTPFFRSPEAFHAFLSDPAYPDFLRRLGLDPEDAGAREEWEDAQYNAILRTQ